MALAAAFLRKSPADRRILVLAAVLHVAVAVAIRMLPFGRVRKALRHAATLGPRPRPVADVDARVEAAVRTVASMLPGASCLTEALVAQCLLARYDRETTLCFGLARERRPGGPFDAHAWLERGGAGVIGARAIVYEPFRHPGRCAPSPSRR